MPKINNVSRLVMGVDLKDGQLKFMHLTPAEQDKPPILSTLLGADNAFRNLVLMGTPDRHGNPNALQVEFIEQMCTSANHGNSFRRILVVDRNRIYKSDASVYYELGELAIDNPSASRLPLGLNFADSADADLNELQAFANWQYFCDESARQLQMRQFQEIEQHNQWQQHEQQVAVDQKLAVLENAKQLAALESNIARMQAGEALELARKATKLSLKQKETMALNQSAVQLLTAMQRENSRSTNDTSDMQKALESLHAEIRDLKLKVSESKSIIEPAVVKEQEQLKPIVEAPVQAKVETEEQLTQIVEPPVPKAPISDYFMPLYNKSQNQTAYIANTLERQGLSQRQKAEFTAAIIACEACLMYLGYNVSENYAITLVEVLIANIIIISSLSLFAATEQQHELTPPIVAQPNPQQHKKKKKKKY